ncbi:MAG: hypothetical protein QM784_13520 [Polyangiaceae bacterium]
MNRREYGSHWDHCVIVPYCEPCARHEQRSKSFHLGARIGSWIVAFSSSILLCLTWLPLFAIVAISILLSILPLLSRAIFTLPRQLGHASRERAVWVSGETVHAASASWAERVSELNGAQLRRIRLRFSRLGAWAVAGPIVALFLGPFAFQALRPRLRVLNFTDARLTIYVDGHRLGYVEPTSGEHPAAGAEFRVPSGRRRLSARQGGKSSGFDVSVVVRNGLRHVFAPGATPGCLYVQRLAYGLSRLGESAEPKVIEVEPLESKDRFWTIAADVEPWFVPERRVSSGVTTGGVVSLLRMGQCR